MTTTPEHVAPRFKIISVDVPEELAKRLRNLDLDAETGTADIRHTLKVIGAPAVDAWLSSASEGEPAADTPEPFAVVTSYDDATKKRTPVGYIALSKRNIGDNVSPETMRNLGMPSPKEAYDSIIETTR